MHYYCEGGCGGHSAGPATCHTEGCPKKGETFVECDCGDEMSHAKKSDSEKAADTEKNTGQ